MKGFARKTTPLRVPTWSGDFHFLFQNGFFSARPLAEICRKYPRTIAPRCSKIGTFRRHVVSPMSNSLSQSSIGRNPFGIGSDFGPALADSSNAIQSDLLWGEGFIKVGVMSLYFAGGLLATTGLLVCGIATLFGLSEAAMRVRLVALIIASAGVAMYWINLLSNCF